MRFPPGTIKRVRRVKLKASGKTDLLIYANIRMRAKPT